MYHDTDVHIGRRMRERRVALGLSQTALSEKLGISFQQVQKYENGANRLSGSRIWDVCRALNVRPDFFFEGLGDMPTSTPEEEETTRLVLETVKDLRSLEPTQLQPIRQIIKAVREANDTAKAMPAAE